MRAVTASKICVTGTVRRGAFAVAATAAWMRSTLPLESFMAMMLRVLGQFRDGLDRYLVRDKLWDVVEDDRERRAIGYAAKVVEHGGRGHLSRIVAGRADEDSVVLVLRRCFGQFDRRFDAFAPHSGDEDFFRRRGFSGHAQDVAGFGVVQHDRLACGAEDRHSREQAARVTGHVGFDLAKIDALIGVKRSGYRGKDTLYQHVLIVEPGVRTRDSSLLRLAGIVPLDRSSVW